SLLPSPAPDGDSHPVTLEGPLLLFGDPYSNLPATRALLSAAAERGIPSNPIVCTGDVVACGAEPVPAA
ncbi:MAG: metallophosphoesterase family protein, partial [bacterium]